MLFAGRDRISVRLSSGLPVKESPVTDRILVVEDDRALGAQVVDHLRGAGYEPTWWTDGSAMIKGAPP